MKLKKLNSLQAGRGLAALMVVLYHANGRYGFGGRRHLGHIFSFGFAGVDFFFVLSGFIIAYTSFHLIGQKNGIGLFLKKRIIRIYPIYWFYLIVALVVGFIQYQNLHIFDHLGNAFLLLPGHPSIIQTSWTLPFELFFYLLVSLLIFSRWTLFLIVPVAILSIINAVLQNFGTYGIFQDHALNDLCTPFNVEFLFGILAYFIYDKIGKPTIYALILIVCVTIVLEIMYFTKAGYNEIYPGQRVLPFGFLAFAAVTAFAALDNKEIFKAPKILVSLGDASYTLYLVHANIFSFAYDTIFMRFKYSEEKIMTLMIFVVSVTILFSFILYKYFERPLIKRINLIWK